jgi:UDP-N-acetylglucosamine 1-carboxyvinyltransferase
MEAFEINGPVCLNGAIEPIGAKNEALQVICASLLTPRPVTIHNIPLIQDVLHLIEILKELGVHAEQIGVRSYRFQAAEVELDRLEGDSFFQLGSALRGSVMLLGPLLGRYGRGIVPRPGGDKIGRRRLDTHIMALEGLGAVFQYDQERSCFDVQTGSGLRGASIFLDEPSVTGTANALMAAVMAQGTTVIYNAACEPYLQQLARLLNAMGAQVEGVGTNQLVIKGQPGLQGTEHTCLPDMIEVGSFIGLAAMTGSSLRIQQAGVAHLGQTVRMFRQLGIAIEQEQDDLIVDQRSCYEIDTYLDGSILTVADGPWPMISPDLLSIALVVATQAKGNVLIHQKMFESRLFFVDELIEMGAQVILCDPHRATVMGLGRQHPLRGIKVRSPDIRAGVALLIAALSAEGRSIIFNVDQIDRGYERIDSRLNQLGAGIQRYSADFNWRT